MKLQRSYNLDDTINNGGSIMLNNGNDMLVLIVSNWQVMYQGYR